MTDIDPMISSRCEAKARACHWTIERLALMNCGANYATDIVPRDRQIIDGGKLCGCFLWMSTRSSPMPDDLSAYSDVAECYRCLGAALRLFGDNKTTIIADKSLLHSQLELVAEAQSALRSAVHGVGGVSDQDQVDAYWWVRQAASENSFYIERYMREVDSADPNAWSDLSRRISQFCEQVENRTMMLRDKRRLIVKCRYQVEQAIIGDKWIEWEAVARTVDELVRSGTPPSDLRIRALLLPHVDVIPSLPANTNGFQFALRETRRFQLLSTDQPIDDESDESFPSVGVAAELLNGKKVVLIGGEERKASKEAIEQELLLEELVWVPCKHGQPVSSFERYVAQNDVTAVLLAIRWSSHAFTDLRLICRKHGKPLIRLPAGYSPNQVAAQIMNQASTQLRKRASRRS